MRCTRHLKEMSRLFSYTHVHLVDELSSYEQEAVAVYLRLLECLENFLDKHNKH